MSNDAQPGESSTTAAPSRAASSRASAKARSTASENPAARLWGRPLHALAMRSAPSPISTAWRTRSRASGSSGAKSWPLSRPPAISTTGRGKLRSATARESRLVALESFTKVTPPRVATVSSRCSRPR